MNECRNCSYCGMDMDMEPFCTNKKIEEVAFSITGRHFEWGLNVNDARPICNGTNFEQHPLRRNEHD